MNNLNHYQREMKAIAQDAGKTKGKGHGVAWLMMIVGVVVTGTMTYSLTRKGMADSSLWREWITIAALLPTVLLEGSALALVYGRHHWFRSEEQRGIANTAGWVIWVLPATTSVVHFAFGSTDSFLIRWLMGIYASYILPLAIVGVPMLWKKLYDAAPDSQMRIAVLEAEAALRSQMVSVEREQKALMIDAYREALDAPRVNAARRALFESASIEHARNISGFIEGAEANKDTSPDFEHASKLYLKHFKGWMIHTITTADAEALRQSRAEGLTNRGAPRAKATLDKEIAILSGLFSMAVRLGYIRSNPCKGVRLYRPDNRRLIILEEDDARCLFDALTGEREKLRPLILLYLHTGTRLRELANLQWEKVDFYGKEGPEITVLGKRKKWRTIPLNDTAYEVLKELRAKSDGKGRVFSEWSAAGISRQISVVCDEIGLPDITTHSLRHTFASTLARQGDVNPEQLRLLMGHSNLKTTQRYFHVDKKSLRGTVKSSKIGNAAIVILTL